TPCIFQNYRLFAFSTIIPQFFRPRSWSDFIYVPMTHNPCLSDMSKRAPRFPLFSNNCLASHKRHICAHALAWPYPSDSYKTIFVVQTTRHACQLRPPTLLPLSLSPLLVVVSLNTFWSTQLLVFFFTIVVSSYSNSCKLVTVNVVVIC
ncbi:unnamed protein product, partial [Hymenolepis diminuta]